MKKNRIKKKKQAPDAKLQNSKRTKQTRLPYSGFYHEEVRS